MAYQLAADTDALYQTRQGQICWRTSEDGGATWSPQVCEWDGVFAPEAAWAGTFGLTATYDRRTQTFLVGYVENGDKRRDYDVVVLTIPAQNSAVAAVTRSKLGVSSVHAPALACRSDLECVAAFQRTDAFGTLGTVTFQIDAVSGEVTSIGTVEGSTIPRQASSNSASNRRCGGR